ncbi:hypothetical protein [Phreatobacter cathodiphilus]|uniref:Uncharacterized protein n=1 Tax=Phreatobacter cathodiphilus TaxID=1868589 RepID=A0A2S0NE30_9HYPH|nr:hypothetical protein [Phreatobacter cathodiphilus]AVO46430.1 hypothetical protein C6569_15970 [Phreatobacter cathodiphilus]
MVWAERWAEFFARHSEQHPGGVIDRLLGDRQRAKGNAESVSQDTPPPPPAGHNRDSPGRIARMLAERPRRGP